MRHQKTATAGWYVGFSTTARDLPGTERVTNEREIRGVEKRETQLLEILEQEGEDRKGPPQAELDATGFARHYWFYHAECVVTHPFGEEEKALDDRKILHVFLDDCVNIVRQYHRDSCSASGFDGLRFEGLWDELFRFAGDICEIGPAYLPGGVRGPPYESPARKTG
ncbi:hypothetical protein Aspvir_006962 [Aspergillus viridinutans]|uniref:Uncharacterized protein n=1 Tax=Aspergillus viridinutans TaxID=75553 RepID=A0A9P3BVB1_ASPVI|nr:uncharacterized protein Aspvir_006962 [Aspergillus viridinutans]GIK02899.1 hypothetical protein Aspvir_006962 [Aspergillus viridinutans]